MDRHTILILLPLLVTAGCDSGTSDSSSANESSPQHAYNSGPASTVTQAPPPSTAPATARPEPGHQEDASHEKLYGTWFSNGVSTPAGEVDVKLTFRKEGPLTLVAWSELPLVGKVREKKGPYEVHGNTISSEAIQGGTSVKYWFDQGQLVIEYADGKTVRFNRQ